MGEREGEREGSCMLGRESMGRRAVLKLGVIG